MNSVLRTLVLIFTGFAACSWGGSAAAQTVTPELPRAYSSAGFAREAPVAPDILRIVFPGATRVGEFSGTPPAAVAFENDMPVGYVFSTRAVIGSVGFSGKPLDILAGLGNDGLIRGAVLRRHSEPILVIGIPEEQLSRYVAALAGLDIRAIRLGAIRPGARDAPDMIVGATISSAVIRDAVVRSARAIARARGLFGMRAAGRLDRETFEPAGWHDLLADGSLVARRIARAEAGLDGDPSEIFVTIHAGLLTPARIGQNLLGAVDFNALLAEIDADDQVVLIAADGLYSFKGTEWVRSGVFERIEIRQAERTIRLTRERHRNVERLRPPDSPAPREIGMFVVPADTGFDPLLPWRLSFLVEREGKSPTTLELPYRLPERYRVPADADADETATTDELLWQRIWKERAGPIAGLAVMLGILSAILVFQDWLTSHTPRYRFVRFVFLAVTFVWLGWFAGAQLSVVNVLTFAHALLTGFHWEFFLIDPLIFILWGYVAVTLLFWGRGVFCGWLCPFGALQELLNEIARRLRVPQFAVPFAVHERLWPIKYIIFLGLFALSLHSTTMAVYAAEVEPFKTAIVLRFARGGPFLLYVALLLAAGLFVERFFCRYLCPLGAALAIPARLRMFEWLKRRHQCGRECHICAVRCTVQAIHPNGAINPNECIYCLNCQSIYHDAHTCPPLIHRRQRRQAQDALRAAAAQGPTPS
jgi:transcriptional regulator of nitric oxide reductase